MIDMNWKGNVVQVFMDKCEMLPEHKYYVYDVLYVISTNTHRRNDFDNVKCRPYM